MNTKMLEKIESLKQDELGNLKGGFAVYAAVPQNPDQVAVTVSVVGECGCSCSAEG